LYERYLRWVAPILLCSAQYYELFTSNEQSTFIRIEFTTFLLITAALFVRVVWHSVSVVGTGKSRIETLYAFYFLALLHFVIIGAYAVLYRQFGLMAGGKNVTDAEDFLYFSIITWTTGGYGDIVPASQTRLLAATEALFGYIGLGLYIALLFHAMSRCPAPVD
jgi:hypothetical protein